MTGGAVKNTCEHVREALLEMGRRKNGSYHPAWAHAELLLEGGKVVTDGARSSRTSPTSWRTRRSTSSSSSATVRRSPST